MSSVIGGEFAIAADKAINATLPDDKWHMLPADGYFSSGRAAIFAILSSIGEQEVTLLLPAYLCSSVTQTVRDAGWRYQFYDVQPDLYPDVSCLLVQLRQKQARAVLLINYFGLLRLDDVVAAIRRECPQVAIILDDVQHFFGFGQEPDFDFCFTSLRKWLPVPDGGLVKLGKRCCDTSLPAYDETLPFTAYKLAGNLLKSFPQLIPDDLCLELLKRGEELLDEQYRGGLSCATELLLRSIDIQKVARRRQANAAVLHRGLEKLGIAHGYQTDAVPLFVPIFLAPEQRDTVRRAFFQEQIFCPVHWPKAEAGLSGNSEIYATELSLICDQRYGEQDMERQLAVLRDRVDL
jgi:hypothetical protein